MDTSIPYSSETGGKKALRQDSLEFVPSYSYLHTQPKTKKTDGDGITRKRTISHLIYCERGAAEFFQNLSIIGDIYFSQNMKARIPEFPPLHFPLLLIAIKIQFEGKTSLDVNIFDKNPGSISGHSIERNFHYRFENVKTSWVCH